ncbi:MAG TPA: hypothetical protein VFW40_12860, partial [Capsulimonadaceae bacterium]|nr:hypothetical protein [Capsulimonadaceae bacterium]
LERDWLISQAFRVGHQWVEWNVGTGQLTTLYDRDDPQERYRHITVNLIRECMLLVGAAVTQNRPDVNFSSLTGREIDMAATQEARAINDHCDREFCDELQLRALVDLALTSTTTFLYQYWDPKKEEDVPVFDQAGQITGLKKLPVGGVREEIVPAYYLYPDPKAKTWEHCPRVCHVSIRDLNEMIDEYGAKAKGLEPDTYSTPAGFIESRLDWINRDFGQSTFNTIKNAVTVYSVWDRPNNRFPKGRYIVVANNRVLRYEDWPYEDKTKFPFTPLGFEYIPHSLWALNNVLHLIPLQMTYNRVYSRIMDRLQNDKLTLLIQRGAEVGPDAYESDRQKEVIYYNLGAQPPAFQQPPPVNPEWFQMLATIKGDMQEMSGARDVARGTVPNGVTAAQAIEMLQVANASQLTPFLGNIERFVEQRAERRVALYAQFARGVPRLIGLSESADPTQAMANVQAFRALRGGGKTRVVVTPGSARPSSPEAQNERVVEWFKEGMFGPPIDPMAAVAAWKAMDHAKSDAVVEDLTRMRLQLVQEQAAKAQQDAQGSIPPAALEAQAKAQAQQTQTQHEAELEAIRHHHELEKMKVQHEMDMAKLAAEHLHEEGNPPRHD